MSSRKLRKSIICFALVFMFGLCSMSPAFADINYYGGAWYDHGTFSFTDYTLTSMRRIMERYVAIRLDFHKPYWDTGLGDINLTFEIRDADTGQTIVQYVLGPAGSTQIGNSYTWVDLGYAGRYVRFFFDASSAGTSNGNYRSATIDVFRVYVYD